MRCTRGSLRQARPPFPPRTLTTLLLKDGATMPEAALETIATEPSVGLACGQVHCVDIVEGLRCLHPNSVDLIFTDAPHYAGASYPADEYRDWCRGWIGECARVLADGGSLYLKHLPECCADWLTMTQDLGLTFRRWLTWVYPHGSAWVYPYADEDRSRNWTRAQRAIIFVTKGDDYTFNANAETYDWWEHRTPENSPEQEANWGKRVPLQIVERIVKASSNRGDVVLDPFLGSGTTAVAAAKHGRRWIGFDTNPRSAESTIARVAAEVP